VTLKTKLRTKPALKLNTKPDAVFTWTPFTEEMALPEEVSSATVFPILTYILHFQTSEEFPSPNNTSSW
jgi:hypothetical protein